MLFLQSVAITVGTAAFVLKLVVELEGATDVTVVTDETWKLSPQTAPTLGGG